MSLKINEETTGLLEADLIDELDAAVPGSNLDTALLTIRNAKTGLVVNGRSDVDIRSYVDEDGHLAFPLTTGDTTMISRLTPTELHVATVVLTWDSKQLTELIPFQITRVNP